MTSYHRQRGGSWLDNAHLVRCATRNTLDSDEDDAVCGFRPVAEEMYRILRGGSKFARRGTCRCACRFRFDPSDRHVALYGFRPVADPPTSR